jgi:hypothetical protein
MLVQAKASLKPFQAASMPNVLLVVEVFLIQRDWLKTESTFFFTFLFPSS